jgi:Cytochrome P460
MRCSYFGGGQYQIIGKSATRLDDGIGSSAQGNTFVQSWPFKPCGLIRKLDHEPDNGATTMKRRGMVISVSIAMAVAILGAGAAMSGQDKYSVKIPNGLAFSEFKGYEVWQTIAVSHNGDKLAVILGNPAMIDAFKAGYPGNGKAFPDGAKMAKIHWTVKKNESEPGQPLVPGGLHDVDFMAKDSKRFSDSGGWGYGAFEYDAASDTFRPGTQEDQPPQGTDAKCGFACHTVVKGHDYVFTEYQKR